MSDKYNIIQTDTATVLFIPKKEEEQKEHLKQKMNYDNFINILADIIIPMAPALAHTMKPGGYVITSGIIDFKEMEVRQALEAAGLTITECNAQGEWRNITARKEIVVIGGCHDQAH